MLARREFLIGSTAAFAGGCLGLPLGARAGGVRFGIVSDTHYRGPADDAALRRLFTALKEAEVDAVLHCGDVTDLGYTEAFAGFNRVRTAVLGEDIPFIYALGNRDLTDTGSIDPERKRRDAGLFLKDGPIGSGAGVKAFAVKGVNIVVLDWKHEGELEQFMSDRPELRDPLKPLVVLQHPCIKHTVFNAGGWACSEQGGVYLKMYPNAIAFCGHTHYRFSVPRSLWQDGFIAAAAGSYHLPPSKPSAPVGRVDGREFSVLTVSPDRYFLLRRDLENGYSETKTFFFERPRPLPAKVAGEFTFLQWNLGHFDFGRSRDTRLSSAEAKARLADYRSALRDFDADFAVLSEYSAAMDTGKTVPSRQALFGDYAAMVEGSHPDCNCNAIAARRGPLVKLLERNFKVRRQGRYYLAAETEIGGERTVIVASHLDNTGECAAQIEELAETFGDEPRVIISADFNVATGEEFDILFKAGFASANHCTRFGLIPTHRRRQLELTPAIDNVFVKGFEFIDVRPGDLSMKLSDHRPLVCRLKRKGNP